MGPISRNLGTNYLTIPALAHGAGAGGISANQGYLGQGRLVEHSREERRCVAQKSLSAQECRTGFRRGFWREGKSDDLVCRMTQCHDVQKGAEQSPKSGEFFLVGPVEEEKQLWVAIQ